MAEQQAGNGSPEPAAAPRPSAADETDFVAALRGAADGRARATFRNARWLFLRALGLIYTVAFAVLWNQGRALLGSQGLLPVERYLQRLKRSVAFSDYPSVFWLDASDSTLRTCTALGLTCSVLLLLGVDHALLIAVLWALYLSFVHVGQIFYGYGWESLLLEAGFLASLLGSARTLSCRHDLRPIPRIMHLWLVWLLFRLMFGAGLIKLRGDSCWRDLTCLYYHYETQPVPHPLSRLLHHAPAWFHQLGVLFNHFVELLVPFGLFVPRLRNAAALLTCAFQLILILSGNLSFLNWLTIAVAVGCIDDAFWCRVLPGRWQLRAATSQPGRMRWALVGLYSCVVVLLSIEPTLNLLSPHQRMNSSFDPLHLVNTYGAFGSIGREREEVILEGTTDSDPTAGHYREYELPCKPGDVRRRPCWITPYHYRLDWQMWFAALSSFDRQPWLAHLIYKLLNNDAQALGLLANRPFGDAVPRYIRAERYRYRFTQLGSESYWTREHLGSYAPPLSLHDPRLVEFLERYELLAP